ncbi:MAG TPA: hypothetical protein VG841_00420 [Caulobacterales bacterium]|nr:hypothetical protein [Caulobacterales bacterium]
MSDRVRNVSLARGFGGESMRLLASLALVLLLAVSPGARAETAPRGAAATTPDPRALAEAQRFIELGGGERAFVAAATSAFRAAAASRGVDLTGEQWTRVRRVLEAHFVDAAHAFTAEMVQFYATHYRLDDMTAANTYYDTPEGRRYVAAAMDLAMPLVGHLVSGGRLALPELREAALLPSDRYEAAQRLARLMVGRLSEVQILQLQRLGYGADEQIDYYSRGLADALTLEELEAAVAWAASDSSQRLEGPSLEREQAIEVAALHVQGAIDLEALRRDVQDAMQDHHT